MNNIRNIAERIDNYTRSENLTDSPTLRQIYKDYADGITYLNERLAQCEARLQQGKSGEAVICAEKAPSLFAIVPILQSIDIASFLNICQLYGLPQPPLLNVQVYQALESALGEAGTKEGLLAEFRKLSRTQGSEEKVIVVRKLVNLEPDNSEWPRQLQQAEASCVPVLIQKAKQAIIDNDFNTLGELEEALASPGWRVSIPTVVLEKIKSVLNEERQRQLHVRAEEILAAVEKACATKSLQDYNQAQGQWDMLCNIDYYLPSQEENYRFANASSFFEEKKRMAADENEYNELVRQFHGYMQAPYGLDKNELDRNYRRLAELGRDIPVDISGFVRSQKSQREKQEKLRRLLKVTRNATMVVITLLIFASGIFAIWYAIDLKNIRVSLEKALKENDFRQGDQLLERLNKVPVPYEKISARLRDTLKAYEGLKAEQDKGRSFIVSFVNSFKDYNDALDKGDYKAAEQTFADFSTRLKDFQALKRFTHSTLSEKEKNMLEPMNWLLARHRKLHDDIATALKGEDVKTVESLLELYTGSELDFRDEGGKEILKNSRLTSSAEFKERQAKLKEVLADRKILEDKNRKVKEAIAELEAVQGKINRKLEKKEYADEIAVWFDDFQKKYEEALEITPVAEEHSKTLRDLDRTSKEQRERYEDLKKEFEVKQKIALLTDEIGNVGGYDGLILKINRELNGGNLSDNEVKLYNTIAFQLECVKKIHNTYGGGEVSIGQNTDFPYFQDLAKKTLMESRMNKSIAKVEADLKDFSHFLREFDTKVMLIIDREHKEPWPIELYNWVLQIPRKESGGYGGGIEIQTYKLLYENRANRWTIGRLNGVVHIKGNSVTLINQGNVKGVMHLRDVDFLYPSTITNKSLREAEYPILELVDNLTKGLKSISRTDFSKEYCELMRSIGKWKWTHIEQKFYENYIKPNQKSESYSMSDLYSMHYGNKLHLYSIMLLPFVNLDSSKDVINGKEYKPFDFPAIEKYVKEISEIKKRRTKLDEYRWQSLALGHERAFSKSAGSMLASLDLDIVEKIIAYIDIVKTFYDMTLRRRLKPVGIATFEYGNPTFHLGGKLALGDGEVWIMNPGCRMLLAGQCSNGEIKWFSDKAFQSLDASIVLMPEDNINSKEEAAKYIEALREFGTDSPVWPASFPMNVHE